MSAFVSPPQQGLFQDEGKLAFYFPSQVSMETACNHDTCKQQLPIQLHTIFSYFEHFCHNFDIPEMSNNCFLTVYYQSIQFLGIFLFMKRSVM